MYYLSLKDQYRHSTDKDQPTKRRPLNGDNSLIPTVLYDRGIYEVVVYSINWEEFYLSKFLNKFILHLSTHIYYMQ